MTIIRGDRKKHPLLGVELIVISVLALAAGILGLVDGSFDFNIILPGTLDKTSARIAAGGCCVAGVGLLLLGVGFQAKRAWLEMTGVIVIALGFMIMWLGPLVRWMF